MASPEQLQALLRKFRLKTANALYFQTLMGFKPNLRDSVHRYFEEISMDNGGLQDKKALARFKKQFKNDLKLVFKEDCKEPFDSLKVMFGFYLLTFAQSLRQYGDTVISCLCTLSQPTVYNDLLRSLNCKAPASEVIFYFLSLDENFMKKVTTKFESDTPADSQKSLSSQFYSQASEAMSEIINEVLESGNQSSCQEWIQFINKKVTGTRLFDFSYLIQTVMIWPDSTLKSKSLAECFERAILGFQFEGTALAFPIKRLKTYADEFAERGNFDEAISTYYAVYFTGGPESNGLKVEALANSAALRLKMTEDDPRNIPYAISECSMALELDSTHVKSLFRRGMAFALAKKWNEAIVDFERAVELDPNSPAKKELEVARRQVMRRIGS